MILYEIQFFIQKPARQAHHKSCQCASCTKSRHHIGCNCVACIAHEKHKRHDEFHCRQCKKSYIHKAASDTCYCADCKTARRHKLDHRLDIGHIKCLTSPVILLMVKLLVLSADRDRLPDDADIKLGEWYNYYSLS